MKYGNKRDANHAEIRDALRDARISVRDTGDIGGGFPDLVASGLHRQTFQVITALIEIKTKSGELTPDQVEFIDNWQGPIHIVRTRAEALSIFGIEA